MSKKRSNAIVAGEPCSAAEQFAKDSGTHVGAIREATQGYFTIEARDGEAGGWGVADSPYKKVRVVTTVSFSIG